MEAALFLKIVPSIAVLPTAERLLEDTDLRSIRAMQDAGLSGASGWYQKQVSCIE